MKIHAFKILKNENKKEGGKGAPSILKKKKQPKKQFHGTLLRVTKAPTPH